MQSGEQGDLVLVTGSRGDVEDAREFFGGSLKPPPPAPFHGGRKSGAEGELTEGRQGG